MYRLLRGWSVAAISADLVISLPTSRMHLRNLHAKAMTNNLQALALWGITHFRCCISERPSGSGREATDDDLLRFQSLLLDSMSQALIALDAQACVTAWNRRAEQIYGWLEEEALGRSLFELAVPDASEQEGREIMKRLLRGEPWTSEFVATRRDGSTFLALIQNAPIMEGGECIGVIGLPEDITERRRVDESLQQMAREKTVAEDTLWWLAHYDGLTGLPNRALLQDRLKQALAAAQRKGEKVGVHSVDLDEFRNLAVSLGHARADQLLWLVAQRLTATVREADTVARLGVDEFIVLQVEARAPEDLARLAERLVAAFTSPFEIDGEQWHVTASCGIAVYPDDGDDGDDLQQAAQSAMQAAKAAGRDRFEFFRPEFTESARDRLEIASQLQSAINAGAMEVVFQPIVSAADGTVVAVEALARFTSPTRGPVGPNVFIPIAESSGMITPLSHQVRSLAFGWLRRWLDDGYDLSLNFNVSSLVLRQEAFEQGLHRSTIEHGIPASRVSLEITESALLEETAPTMELLARLHAAGYGIAIDDFGTGFSRLASLRSPSLTSLKLDRFFVADLETDERSHGLVKFAIGVGHDLGLTVVAEGVETEGQYHFLRGAGVDQCQGYLFSRPIPGEEVAAFVETRNTLSDRARMLRWRRAS